jgi:anhydro-N-acetylmuramic acid kinase
MRAIGLMSGTSLDGIDAAFIETNGEHITALGPSLTHPFDPQLRRDLRRAIDSAGEDPDVADIERRLTLAHVEAVRALNSAADIIGFHGQTILHAPERRLTVQIGDAALLARETGTNVAYDFRQADVAAGGQGAPLVPIFHAALAEKLEKPLAVINIGGVANLTWIGPDGALIACDTGPGGALIDDFMAARTGRPMDENGRHAAAGTPNEPILTHLLSNPYFTRPAPKSLDRQHFAYALQAVSTLSTEDGAATLAAFTARAIIRALPAPPKRLLITGGGRHNAAIMGALGPHAEPVESVGWNGDALEAQCFAYLAVRVKCGLPLSFPTTTGVPAPMPGGRLVIP